MYNPFGELFEESRLTPSSKLCFMGAAESSSNTGSTNYTAAAQQAAESAAAIFAAESAAAQQAAESAAAQQAAESAAAQQAAESAAAQQAAESAAASAFYGGATVGDTTGQTTTYGGATVGDTTGQTTTNGTPYSPPPVPPPPTVPMISSNEYVSGFNPNNDPSLPNYNPYKDWSSERMSSVLGYGGEDLGMPTGWSDGVFTYGGKSSPVPPGTTFYQYWSDIITKNNTLPMDNGTVWDIITMAQSAASQVTDKLSYTGKQDSRPNYVSKLLRNPSFMAYAKTVVGSKGAVVPIEDEDNENWKSAQDEINKAMNQQSITLPDGTTRLLFGVWGTDKNGIWGMQPNWTKDEKGNWHENTYITAIGEPIVMIKRLINGEYLVSKDWIGDSGGDIPHWTSFKDDTEGPLLKRKYAIVELIKAFQEGRIGPAEVLDKFAIEKIESSLSSPELLGFVKMDEKARSIYINQLMIDINNKDNYWVSVEANRQYGNIMNAISVQNFINSYRGGEDINWDIDGKAILDGIRYERALSIYKGAINQWNQDKIGEKPLEPVNPYPKVVADTTDYAGQIKGLYESALAKVNAAKTDEFISPTSWELDLVKVVADNTKGVETKWKEVVSWATKTVEDNRTSTKITAGAPASIRGDVGESTGENRELVPSDAPVPAITTVDITKTDDKKVKSLLVDGKWVPLAQIAQPEAGDKDVATLKAEDKGATTLTDAQTLERVMQAMNNIANNKGTAVDWAWVEAYNTNKPSVGAGLNTMGIRSVFSREIGRILTSIYGSSGTAYFGQTPNVLSPGTTVEQVAMARAWAEPWVSAAVQARADATDANGKVDTSKVSPWLNFVWAQYESAGNTTDKQVNWYTLQQNLQHIIDLKAAGDIKVPIDTPLPGVARVEPTVTPSPMTDAQEMAMATYLESGGTVRVNDVTGKTEHLVGGKWAEIKGAEVDKVKVGGGVPFTVSALALLPVTVRAVISGMVMGKKYGIEDRTEGSAWDVYMKTYNPSQEVIDKLKASGIKISYNPIVTGSSPITGAAQYRADENTLYIDDRGDVTIDSLANTIAHEVAHATLESMPQAQKDIYLATLAEYNRTSSSPIDLSNKRVVSEVFGMLVTGVPIQGFSPITAKQLAEMRAFVDKGEGTAAQLKTILQPYLRQGEFQGTQEIDISLPFPTGAGGVSAVPWLEGVFQPKVVPNSLRVGKSIDVDGPPELADQTVATFTGKGTVKGRGLAKDTDMTVFYAVVKNADGSVGGLWYKDAGGKWQEGDYKYHPKTGEIEKIVCVGAACDLRAEDLKEGIKYVVDSKWAMPTASAPPSSSTESKPEYETRNGMMVLKPREGMPKEGMKWDILAPAASSEEGRLLRSLGFKQFEIQAGIEKGYSVPQLRQIAEMASKEKTRPAILREGLLKWGEETLKVKPERAQTTPISVGTIPIRTAGISLDFLMPKSETAKIVPQTMEVVNSDDIGLKGVGKGIRFKGSGDVDYGGVVGKKQVDVDYFVVMNPNGTVGGLYWKEPGMNWQAGDYTYMPNTKEVMTIDCAGKSCQLHEDDLKEGIKYIYDTGGFAQLEKWAHAVGEAFPSNYTETIGLKQDIWQSIPYIKQGEIISSTDPLKSFNEWVSGTTRTQLVDNRAVTELDDGSLISADLFEGLDNNYKVVLKTLGIDGYNKYWEDNHIKLPDGESLSKDYFQTLTVPEQEAVLKEGISGAFVKGADNSILPKSIFNGLDTDNQNKYLQFGLKDIKVNEVKISGLEGYKLKDGGYDLFSWAGDVNTKGMKYSQIESTLRGSFNNNEYIAEVLKTIPTDEYLSDYAFNNLGASEIVAYAKSRPNDPRVKDNWAIATTIEENTSALPVTYRTWAEANKVANYKGDAKWAMQIPSEGADFMKRVAQWETAGRKIIETIPSVPLQIRIHEMFPTLNLPKIIIANDPSVMKGMLFRPTLFVGTEPYSTEGKQIESGLKQYREVMSKVGEVVPFLGTQEQLDKWLEGNKEQKIQQFTYGKSFSEIKPTDTPIRTRQEAEKIYNQGDLGVGVANVVRMAWEAAKTMPEIPFIVAEQFDELGAGDKQKLIDIAITAGGVILAPKQVFDTSMGELAAGKKWKAGGQLVGFGLSMFVAPEAVIKGARAGVLDIYSAVRGSKGKELLPRGMNPRTDIPFADLPPVFDVVGALTKAKLQNIYKLPPEVQRLKARETLNPYQQYIYDGVLEIIDTLSESPLPTHSMLKNIDFSKMVKTLPDPRGAAAVKEVFRRHGKEVRAEGSAQDIAFIGGDTKLMAKFGLGGDIDVVVPDSWSNADKARLAKEFTDAYNRDTNAGYKTVNEKMLTNNSEKAIEVHNEMQFKGRQPIFGFEELISHEPINIDGVYFGDVRNQMFRRGREVVRPGVGEGTGMMGVPYSGKEHLGRPKDQPRFALIAEALIDELELQTGDTALANKLRQDVRNIFEAPRGYPKPVGLDLHKVFMEEYMNPIQELVMQAGRDGRKLLSYTEVQRIISERPQYLKDMINNAPEEMAREMESYGVWADSKGIPREQIYAQYAKIAKPYGYKIVKINEDRWVLPEKSPDLKRAIDWIKKEDEITGRAYVAQVMSKIDERAQRMASEQVIEGVPSALTQEAQDLIQLKGLADRMEKGEAAFTPEELQLQVNYSKELESILKERVEPVSAKVEDLSKKLEDAKARWQEKYDALKTVSIIYDPKIEAMKQVELYRASVDIAKIAFDRGIRTVNEFTDFLGTEFAKLTEEMKGIVIKAWNDTFVDKGEVVIPKDMELALTNEITERIDNIESIAAIAEKTGLDWMQVQDMQLYEGYKDMLVQYKIPYTGFSYYSPKTMRNEGNITYLFKDAKSREWALSHIKQVKGDYNTIPIIKTVSGWVDAGMPGDVIDSSLINKIKKESKLETEVGELSNLPEIGIKVVDNTENIRENLLERYVADLIAKRLKGVSAEDYIGYLNTGERGKKLSQKVMDSTWEERNKILDSVEYKQYEIDINNKYPKNEEAIISIAYNPTAPDINRVDIIKEALYDLSRSGTDVNTKVQILDSKGQIERVDTINNILGKDYIPKEIPPEIVQMSSETGIVSPVSTIEGKRKYSELQNYVDAVAKIYKLDSFPVTEKFFTKYGGTISGTRVGGELALEIELPSKWSPARLIQSKSQQMVNMLHELVHGYLIKNEKIMFDAVGREASNLFTDIPTQQGRDMMNKVIRDVLHEHITEAYTARLLGNEVGSLKYYDAWAKQFYDTLVKHSGETKARELIKSVDNYVKGLPYSSEYPNSNLITDVVSKEVKQMGLEKDAINYRTIEGKEVAIVTPETLSQKLANVKAVWKDKYDALKQQSFIYDPKIEAMKQVELYYATLDVAKVAFDNGIRTVEEFARELGVEISDIMRKAWDDTYAVMSEQLARTVKEEQPSIVIEPKQMQLKLTQEEAREIVGEYHRPDSSSHAPIVGNWKGNAIGNQSQRGWKVHIVLDNTGMYRDSVAQIKQWLVNNYNGEWKYLEGGDIFDADFTVYLGDKATLNAFVTAFDKSDVSKLISRRGRNTDRFVGDSGLSARFDVSTEKWFYGKAGTGLPYDKFAAEAYYSLMQSIKEGDTQGIAYYRKQLAVAEAAIIKQLINKYGDKYISQGDFDLIEVNPAKANTPEYNPYTVQEIESPKKPILENIVKIAKDNGISQDVIDSSSISQLIDILKQKGLQQPIKPEVVVAKEPTVQDLVSKTEDIAYLEWYKQLDDYNKGLRTESIWSALPEEAANRLNKLALSSNNPKLYNRAVEAVNGKLSLDQYKQFVKDAVQELFSSPATKDVVRKYTQSYIALKDKYALDLGKDLLPRFNDDAQFWVNVDAMKRAGITDGKIRQAANGMMSDAEYLSIMGEVIERNVKDKALYGAERLQAMAQDALSNYKQYRDVVREKSIISESLANLPKQDLDSVMDTVSKNVDMTTALIDRALLIPELAVEARLAKTGLLGLKDFRQFISKAEEKTGFLITKGVDSIPYYQSSRMAQGLEQVNWRLNGLRNRIDDMVYILGQKVEPNLRRAELVARNIQRFTDNLSKDANTFFTGYSDRFKTMQNLQDKINIGLGKANELYEAVASKSWDKANEAAQFLKVLFTGYSDNFLTFRAAIEIADQKLFVEYLKLRFMEKMFGRDVRDLTQYIASGISKVNAQIKIQTDKTWGKIQPKIQGAIDKLSEQTKSLEGALSEFGTLMDSGTRARLDTAIIDTKGKLATLKQNVVDTTVDNWNENRGNLLRVSEDLNNKVSPIMSEVSESLRSKVGMVMGGVAKASASFNNSIQRLNGEVTRLAENIANQTTITWNKAKGEISNNIDRLNGNLRNIEQNLSEVSLLLDSSTRARIEGLIGDTRIKLDTLKIDVANVTGNLLEQNRASLLRSVEDINANVTPILIEVGEKVRQQALVARSSVIKAGAYAFTSVTNATKVIVTEATKLSQEISKQTVATWDKAKFGITNQVNLLNQRLVDLNRIVDEFGTLLDSATRARIEEVVSEAKIKIDGLSQDIANIAGDTWGINGARIIQLSDDIANNVMPKLDSVIESSKANIGVVINNLNKVALDVSSRVSNLSSIIAQSTKKTWQNVSINATNLLGELSSDIRNIRQSYDNLSNMMESGVRVRIGESINDIESKVSDLSDSIRNITQETFAAKRADLLRVAEDLNNRTYQLATDIQTQLSQRTKIISDTIQTRIMQPLSLNASKLANNIKQASDATSQYLSGVATVTRDNVLRTIDSARVQINEMQLLSDELGRVIENNLISENLSGVLRDATDNLNSLYDSVQTNIADINRDVVLGIADKLVENQGRLIELSSTISESARMMSRVISQRTNDAMLLVKGNLDNIGKRVDELTTMIKQSKVIKGMESKIDNILVAIQKNIDDIKGASEYLGNQLSSESYAKFNEALYALDKLNSNVRESWQTVAGKTGASLNKERISTINGLSNFSKAISDTTKNFDTYVVDIAKGESLGSELMKQEKKAERMKAAEEAYSVWQERKATERIVKNQILEDINKVLDINKGLRGKILDGSVTLEKISEIFEGVDPQMIVDIVKTDDANRQQLAGLTAPRTSSVITQMSRDSVVRAEQLYIIRQKIASGVVDEVEYKLYESMLNKDTTPESLVTSWDFYKDNQSKKAQGDANAQRIHANEMDANVLKEKIHNGDVTDKDIKEYVVRWNERNKGKKPTKEELAVNTKNWQEFKTEALKEVQRVKIPADAVYIKGKGGTLPVKVIHTKLDTANVDISIRLNHNPATKGIKLSNNDLHITLFKEAEKSPKLNKALQDNLKDMPDILLDGNLYDATLGDKSTQILKIQNQDELNTWANKIRKDAGLSKSEQLFHITISADKNLGRRSGIADIDSAEIVDLGKIAREKPEGTLIRYLTPAERRIPFMQYHVSPDVTDILEAIRQHKPVVIGYTYNKAGNLVKIPANELYTSSQIAYDRYYNILEGKKGKNPGVIAIALHPDDLYSEFLPVRKTDVKGVKELGIQTPFGRIGGSDITWSEILLDEWSAGEGTTLYGFVNSKGMPIEIDTRHPITRDKMPIYYVTTERGLEAGLRPPPQVVVREVAINAIKEKFKDLTHPHLAKEVIINNPNYTPLSEVGLLEYYQRETPFEFRNALDSERALDAHIQEVASKATDMVMESAKKQWFTDRPSAEFIKEKYNLDISDIVDMDKHVEAALRYRFEEGIGEVRRVLSETDNYWGDIRDLNNAKTAKEWAKNRLKYEDEIAIGKRTLDDDLLGLIADALIQDTLVTMKSKYAKIDITPRPTMIEGEQPTAGIDITGKGVKITGGVIPTKTVIETLQTTGKTTPTTSMPIIPPTPPTTFVTTPVTPPTTPITPPTTPITPPTTPITPPITPTTPPITPTTPPVTTTTTTTITSMGTKPFGKIPKGERRTWESLTREEKLAAIVFKQGWAYWCVYPPYLQNNLIYSSKPFPGTKIHAGPKSAYKSVAKVKGAELPEKIELDLGIMDIIFQKDDKGKDVRIYYRADPKQKTTGQGPTGWPVSQVHRTSGTTQVSSVG